MRGCAGRGWPFTFHKAIDHVADREQAFAAIRALPGVDTVLTSGGPFPAGQGAPVLGAESHREAALGVGGLEILVGGGLKLADLPALRAAGPNASTSAPRPHHGDWPGRSIPIWSPPPGAAPWTIDWPGRPPRIERSGLTASA